MDTYHTRARLAMSLPILLVLGSFTIAVIDPNYRQPFMDLTKVILVGIASALIRLRRQIH
jgi:hypothetical protein